MGRIEVHDATIYSLATRCTAYNNQVILSADIVVPYVKCV